FVGRFVARFALRGQAGGGPGAELDHRVVHDHDVRGRLGRAGRGGPADAGVAAGRAAGARRGHGRAPPRRFVPDGRAPARGRVGAGNDVHHVRTVGAGRFVIGVGPVADVAVLGHASATPMLGAPGTGRDSGTGTRGRALRGARGPRRRRVPARGAAARCGGRPDVFVNVHSFSRTFRVQAMLFSNLCAFS